MFQFNSVLNSVILLLDSLPQLQNNIWMIYIDYIETEYMLYHTTNVLLVMDKILQLQPHCKAIVFFMSSTLLILKMLCLVQSNTPFGCGGMAFNIKQHPIRSITKS